MHLFWLSRHVRHAKTQVSRTHTHTHTHLPPRNSIPTYMYIYMCVYVHIHIYTYMKWLAPFFSRKNEYAHTLSCKEGAGGGGAHTNKHTRGPVAFAERVTRFARAHDLHPCLLCPLLLGVDVDQGIVLNRALTEKVRSTTFGSVQNNSHPQGSPGCGESWR